MAEGHAMREELTDYRQAWLVAYLLQPYAKGNRTLRPEQFLGRPLKYVKAPVSEYPAKDIDRALGVRP